MKKKFVNVLLTANGREMVAKMEESHLNQDRVESKVAGVRGVVWKWVAPASWGPKPDQLTGEETLDVLRESFHAFCGSYERIPALMSLPLDPTDPSKWFRLLGELWEVCDNVGHFKQGIWERLKEADRALLDAMMTAEELEAWRKLPEEITAFRGCSETNKDGLSFSLNREIAEKFPTLNRYYSPHPILIEACISKHRAVLKLGRDEFEIIATAPENVTVVSATAIESLERP